MPKLPSQMTSRPAPRPLAKPVAIPGRRPPLAAKPEWKDAVLYVPVNEDTPSPKTVSVNGKRLGTFGVYISTENPATWTVSCLTVGRALTRTKTEADALRIGTHLHNTVPEPFRLSVASAILAALPKWVGVWCKQCQEAKAWVDPYKLMKEIP